VTESKSPSAADIIKSFHGHYKEIAFAGILLLLHFFLIITASMKESPVFDESVHIASGLSYWQQNDYRLNPENGNFPQRWAALPLLFQNLDLPDLSRLPLVRTDSWSIGRNLIFSSQESPDGILLRSRIFIALLSIITGIAVYSYSRRVFGIKGGLLSLFLYILYPDILAHAGLATSDMAATMAFTLSLIALWNVLNRITAANILFSSSALGLLFITKFSAVIIIPVYLILILARLLLRKPLECKIFKWRKIFDQQTQQIISFLSVCLVNALVILFVIWASYGFRFSMLANENASDRQVLDSNFRSICRSAPETGILLKMRDFKILPEAYLFGFAFVVQHSKARYSFLCGELSRKGWWYFFPYSFIVKTPFPLLLIFALSLFAVSGYFPNIREYLSRETVYSLLPFIVFIAVYMAFAMSSNLNIGHRHLLPIYPALFMISGALVLIFNEKSFLLKSLMLFLVAWYAAESFMIRPHYLAYFNQLAGGPEKGYRNLVDSSLDWGQDLKTLRRWLDANVKNGDPVYVSYFGTADMKYYLSNFRMLPCYFDQEGKTFEPFGLKKGVYCISATMFQFTYFDLAFKDKTGLGRSQINENLFSSLSVEIRDYFSGKTSFDNIDKDPKELAKYYEFRRNYGIYNYLRFAKLCIYLSQRKPDGYAGYSILIFRLSDKDIEDALSN